MRRYCKVKINFNLVISNIVILLLLVSSGTAQSVKKIEQGLYSTNEIKTSIKATGKKRLIIKAATNLAGRLIITTKDTDRIEIRYSKQTKTYDRSRAIDFIDLIALSLVQKPKGSLLELRAPNPAPWDKQSESGMIVAEIVLPVQFSLEIEATYFDVTAEGPFKEVVIPNSLGRVEISNVSALLDVKTANRRLILDNITGEILASTTNSSLIGKDIKATSAIARFRNNGGDIKLENFSGGINVKNSFGRISLTKFEPKGSRNLVRGRSSPIYLEIKKMNEGQLVIDNKHEGIDITIPNDISAYMSLTVDDDGSIEATSFPFKTELIQSKRLNLIAGDGKVSISSSISGEGNIFIRGVEVD